MPEETESLILEASVIDDFSRELNELQQSLGEIEATEEAVDPVDIDVTIAEALAKIEAFDKRLDQLDNKDVDVDIDTDTGMPEGFRGGGMAGGDEMADMMRFFEREDGIMPLGGRLSESEIDRRAENAIARARRIDIGTERENIVGQFATAGLRAGADEGTDLADLPDMGAGAVAGGVTGFGLDERRNGFRRWFDEAREGIGEAIDEFKSLRLSMGMLMNMLASLVPLIGIFVGALPAAIAGVGALGAAALAAAGALTAVGGLAIGAMLFEGGELNVREAQEQLRDLLDVMLESFAPLMEALKPVAEALFRNAEFMARDLAQHMNLLTRLTDEAGQAIRWMAGVLGPAVEDIILFGEAAMPIISMVAGGIASIDFFEIFADIIVETLPLLAQFTKSFVGLFPIIYQASLAFFSFANAILSTFNLLLGLVGAIPGGMQAIGSLISVIFIAVSASSLWSIATSNVALRVYELGVTIYEYTLGYIYSYIAGQYSAAAATLATAAAATVLLGVITFGLAPAITFLTSKLAGTHSQIGSAADEMKRFRKEADRVNTPNVGGPAEGDRGSYDRPGYGTTVVAPDKDTGNAVAATQSWRERSSETTPPGDVENRQHSG
jgi:hypothetical protein